jgi:CheY-like chemotaxis protein
MINAAISLKILLVAVALWVLWKLAAPVITILKNEFQEWASILQIRTYQPASTSDLSPGTIVDDDSLSDFKADFLSGSEPAPAVSTAESIEKTASEEAKKEIDPLQDFFTWVPGHLAALRQLHQSISRTLATGISEETVRELRLQITALKTRAELPELAPVNQMASALEGLVKQLGDNVRDVTPSTLRTIATALDLLGDLCTPALKADLATNPPIHLLAVDDDPVSRIAINFALKRAFDLPDLADSGETALALAAENPYDVIFLDVQMPGMDGFELCSKIHGTEANRATPVVFVTGMKDFEARAKSIVSGGSELIGKPFLSFEIVVKALTFALRRRLPVTAPVPAVAPATSAAKTLVQNIVPPAGKPASPAALPAKPEEGVAGNALEERRQLGLLQVRMQSLTRELDAKDFRPALQLASALEALFRKLNERPDSATASTLFTAMSAMELLKDLCVPGVDPELASASPISILVVDDEPIARRAVVGSLQLAFLKPDSAESGEAAVALASTKSFDVIFLDVQMPGMDGFIACGKIHEAEANQHTPVIFVTRHTDAETRARCVNCGGSDFLAKPILFVEITVKALTYALRGRLQKTAVKHQELAAVAN